MKLTREGIGIGKLSVRCWSDFPKFALLVNLTSVTTHGAHGEVQRATRQERSMPLLI